MHTRIYNYCIFIGEMNIYDIDQCFRLPSHLNLFRYLCIVCVDINVVNPIFVVQTPNHMHFSEVIKHVSCNCKVFKKECPSTLL